MRTLAMGIALAMALSLISAAAHAQTWKPPADAQRCPSKWGAADERGSGNHMKPESVLKATRLIKTGEVIEIAHVLNDKMPFAGTQLDGFAHQSIEYSHYNCFKTDEISSRTGFTKLGIEKVGTLMTRGVLIDVAALKGVDMLGDAYEITPQDLQQALQRQNLQLQPGDAILINTGWHRLWAKDNARYNKSCPGIGVAAAEWLAKQDPMLVGADNGPVEVSPNPDPQISLPVHQIMLVVNGIHILENLKLDDLAAKKVYEFAFVMQPLKAQGFSGSTVAPVAIR
jgi:kynurenine formamidase